MNWLRWTQRIQAIAQTGLTYAADPFDRERYEQLRALAVEIGSTHLDKPSAEVARLIASETGYPTPKVDVRAAVFSTRGELLFVRETSDGRWTLPGGWADGGHTPAEVAVKETREESGYQVRAVKLIAALDRDRQGHPPLAWPVYKLFFRCELLGGAPANSHETTDATFFSRDKIPPLSTGRILPTQVERMFRHYDHPELPTDFE
jgi:ADP-ribose pyrophosphatase YjhB (NUDIX family)